MTAGSSIGKHKNHAGPFAIINYRFYLHKPDAILRQILPNQGISIPLLPGGKPPCSTKTSVAIRKKKMAGAEDASHSELNRHGKCNGRNGCLRHFFSGAAVSATELSDCTTLTETDLSPGEATEIVASLVPSPVKGAAE